MFKRKGMLNKWWMSNINAKENNYKNKPNLVNILINIGKTKREFQRMKTHKLFVLFSFIFSFFFNKLFLNLCALFSLL